MPYNKHIAQKVRNALANTSRVEEKNMMGGLTFMVNGKMCVGVLRDDLMARINPEVYDAVLKRKGCRPMDFTRKPMKGFVFVGPSGTSNKKNLNYWIDLALDFNKIAKASKKKNKKDSNIV